MGDFDRFEKTSQAGDSKKLVMVVVLGAALLALVGYQFVKRGPQQASAAGPSDASDAPSVSETPASLREALANNPTAELLHAQGDAQPAPKPMRNPFRMGSAWLASLHQVQAVKPNQTQPAPRVISSVPILPQAVRAEDYKLNSIVNSGNGMAAIINGKIVRAGDVLGNARVLEIDGQEVVLQHVDFSDGPTTVLSMQPRLNQQ